jgi:purine-nucleoside phosphorylase
LGIRLEEGIYAGVLGPSFETAAEIGFLRTIGADMVGMSTVCETIAARHMGMRVLGISLVTNAAAGMSAGKLSHEEVLDAASGLTEDLGRLLDRVIPSF